MLPIRKTTKSTLTLTPSTLSNTASTIQQLEISSTKEKNVTEKLSVVNTHWLNLMAMSELSTTTLTNGDSMLMLRTQEIKFTSKFKNFRAFSTPTKMFI